MTNILRKGVILLLGFLVSILQQAIAQSRAIEGKVTDEKGILTGASINIKGSKSGTTTDESGAFRLEVPANTKTLVISYIGYQSKEADITAHIPGEILGSYYIKTYL